ncbi:MAG TPA: DNA repair protein RadA [Verrucomicrobiae bacterium]|nr:DNA repair protein RadA [Verrucomicrobiae bacterium]
MARQKTLFVCQNCGQESPKWMGRCAGCDSWNTLVEEFITDSPAKKGRPGTPILLDAIEIKDEARSSTGSRELDRVLGGGIVRGSFILVGGDPGIGKSTLLLQMVHHASKHDKVLYVSGEESVNQIKLRANRLGVGGGKLFLLSETNLNNILAVIEQTTPGLVVIDSIQTVFRDEVQAAPGSVSQVRECAALLMRLAKDSNIPVFLVGHVTKEGNLAGPRVLEHMVDTVLYFEGDRHHSYRILRCVKNRFGATNEIGVFEMAGQGLNEISNPSEVFLAQRATGAAGAVVTSAMEGTRPILVEVQALVSHTNYGNPRRMATGIDYNRVSLLLAVLDKRLGFNLAQQDVFVNLAGGVKLEEPALDLAVMAAVSSSLRESPVDAGVIVFGEVGLTGEVRGVSQAETRVKEAVKMGFRRCIVPKVNLEQIKGIDGIAISAVSTVQEAFEAMLEG